MEIQRGEDENLDDAFLPHRRCIDCGTRIRFNWAMYGKKAGARPGYRDEKPMYFIWQTNSISPSAEMREKRAFDGDASGFGR